MPGANIANKSKKAMTMFPIISDSLSVMGDAWMSILIHASIFPPRAAGGGISHMPLLDKPLYLKSQPIPRVNLDKKFAHNRSSMLQLLL